MLRQLVLGALGYTVPFRRVEYVSFTSHAANARCCLRSRASPPRWLLESRLPDASDLKLAALAASSSLAPAQTTKQTQLDSTHCTNLTNSTTHSSAQTPPNIYPKCPAPPKEAQTQPKPSPQTQKTQAPCKNALGPSLVFVMPPRSALLLRAGLLQLRFQLHREVVARVVVIPALLPQVRGTGL